MGSLGYIIRLAGSENFIGRYEYSGHTGGPKAHVSLTAITARIELKIGL